MQGIATASLRSKLNQILTVLFSKPSDCSTPEGRGRERYRRAAWTTVVMMAARVSNIITGVLSVPITLHYLGEDLYGVWMALTGFVAFLSFYDFGIGTGLRNLLIECNAKDDLETPKKLIGNALLVLSGLAGLMVVVAFTVLPYLPWGELIKCSNPASVRQILPTAQAVLVMFALGLPITQLQNIANAYQRGYWGYLCFLLGRILGFLFVIWCVKANQPLWLLAGGYVGIPFLVTLIGWGVFFSVAHSLRPWPIRPERTLVRGLFGIGFYVLIHHLSFAMINTSGLLLIANTISAASGVPFSITQQLLGVSNVLVASLLIGVSAAVGEAWHRQDYGWIRTTVRRLEKSVLLFGIAPLVLLLFSGQAIILWWTKSPAAVPSFFLLLSCVLASCVTAIGDIYSNSLIAMNFVRFIALTRFVSGVVVVAGGYVTGVVSQSPALIAFLQFAIGAFIPAFLFWWKMKQLLNGAEFGHAPADHSPVLTTCNAGTLPG